jgi:predicted DNA-binding transcriptional regulator AlpA
MTTFDFVLIGSGLDPEADDFEARFFEAGCDDSTIAFQNGRIVADFSREADCLRQALVSAVRDFTAAGARVERIEPDPLVSLADMARRSSLSRAAMTNYATGQRQSGFPPPIAKVSSNSPLWDWAEVADWLRRHGRLDDQAAEQATVVRAANEALAEGGDFGDALSRRITQRELAPA